MTATSGQWDALRAAFPPNAIGKLPRVTQKDGTKSRCSECGGWLPPHIHLEYVGHAAVTDRLLQVDKQWTWEPVAFGDDGLPAIRRDGGESKLWIKLTVLGVTRYGVGIASGFELEKQLISDAIRNAAMRFGVALDLWGKEDFSHDETAGEASPLLREADAPPAPPGTLELDPRLRTDDAKAVRLGLIDAMKPRELAAELADLGLDVVGTVDEMRARLREAVAA